MEPMKTEEILALRLFAFTMFPFLDSGSGGKDPVNKDFSDFYEYDRSLPLNVSEELLKDEMGYRVFKVYFDSVNRKRVPGLFSAPKRSENVPCIVFLHGYGGSKEDVLPFVGIAAAKGYALMAIDAELHGERKEEGKTLYSPDLNATRQGIVQTVIDLRRAVDYLETRPEVDEKRIGYVGGSMGGILGAIFIGVEPRIKAAALLAAGGNMSLMIMKSLHPAILAIRRYIKRVGISYKEIQQFMNPIDPLNFIAKFSPRPVVFHLGKYDRIVPSEAGELLYRNAGEPKKVYWYDSGHNLPLKLVLSRVFDFMDRELLGRNAKSTDV